MAFPLLKGKPEFFKIEEEILSYWKENNTFEKSVEFRPEDNPYRFYDGPPFITGTPHYGSLLSSVIKDVVPRYQTMLGKRVERVWGWDCHGLPIEQKVQAKLGLESNKEIEKVGIKKFIDECYAYTQNTSAEWDWYIDHIGRWVDFENAYRTMDQDYMESVLWVFKALWEKGFVYEGKKVSWYSWKLSTPISNFEIAMDDSYEEAHDVAVTVKFPLTSGVFEGKVLLAWTTTPWTVPAHMAIAVNKDLTYVVVKSNGVEYILAKNRAEEVFKGVGEFEVLEEFSGEKLVGASYTPPFDYYTGEQYSGKKHQVFHADFVTDEDGTGVAHEAPEFGDVDFELAQVEGIHISEAIDEAGKYTSQIPDYEGRLYLDVIEEIADRLKEEGTLFKKESVTHRVPVCPRSKTYLMQKALKSWFIDIKKIKSTLLEKNEDVNWVPEHFKHGRFYKSVESAPDWCISRTRYWGTPMPIWHGYDADGSVQDTKVFGSVEEIQAASGMKVENLHRPYIDDITWEENSLTYRRIPEVFDCWVESGSMPYGQMHYPFENKEKMEASFPADFIAEYTGQIRAWFYVMHVLGVALKDAPAFKNVVVTGVINGTDGRKMSKSYGNYPDPRKTMEQYGADALRFYLMNGSIMRGDDMNFSEDGINEAIKKINLPLWNAYVFFATYANIDGFEKPQGTKSKTKNELDTWILSQLNVLVKRNREDMDSYNISAAAHHFIGFLDDLNNWYIRRNRRRFWKGEMDEDKQAGYETLYEVLTTVCQLLAPICPFISEYLYRNLTGEESVHLTDFPEAQEELIDETINEKVAKLQTIVNLGLSFRSKNTLRVRQPLPAIYLNEEVSEEDQKIIQEELNIKEIKRIDIDQYATPGYFPDARKIGQSDRKMFMKDILGKAKAGEAEVTPEGKLKIQLEEEILLESDEFEVRYTPNEGTDLKFEAGFGTVVGIDDTLTDELILEGYARDLIRVIQEARKEAGYEITDRIRFDVSGDQEVLKALQEHKEMIESEVLGTFEDSSGEFSKDAEIEGKSITLSLAR